MQPAPGRIATRSAPIASWHRHRGLWRQRVWLRRQRPRIADHASIQLALRAHVSNLGSLQRAERVAPLPAADRGQIGLDRLRAVFGRRHARRPGGRRPRVSRGSQAGLEAQHRLRTRDRGQALVGPDRPLSPRRAGGHAGLSCDRPGRTGGRRGPFVRAGGDVGARRVAGGVRVRPRGRPAHSLNIGRGA